MKKKIIFSAMLAFFGSASMNAQYSITDYTCSTAGITESYPVDVEYNSFNARYSSLHSNSVGMSVVNYDATSGSYLSSLNLYRTGSYFSPVKILHFGTFTYVLFNYGVSATSRFAICKYNNATNVLSWVNYLNNAGNNIDQTGKDMALDAAGNVYVLSSYVSGAGDSDLSISLITSAGVLSWNKRYANTTYEESPGNIDYDAGSTQLIVGGTAVNVSSMMDRYALVWRLDAAGVMQASTLINYTGSPSWRISEVCAKRNGKSVLVTATSFVGADGAGPIFVARVAAATLSLITYKVYYANPTYFSGEFNFVNNRTDLVLSGSASFVNTGTPGLVNTMFDLATCSFVSESRYTALPSFPFGGPIYNGYNVSNNELGTIAEDDLNPGYFYFIKSRYDGYTTCEVNPTYSLAPYTIQNNAYTHTPNLYDAFMSGIGHFGIQSTAYNRTLICSYNPCPECAIQPMEGSNVKSLLTADASSALTVYPNPANDKVNVSIEQSDVTITRVELFDVSGRLVLSEASTSNVSTLEISSLKQGMYLLKVSLSDGSMTTKRFTKE